MEVMTESLEDRFPLGREVVVSWRGLPTRGRVRKVDPTRRNRDGSVGAVLVRVGDGHSQTAAFFPQDQVEPAPMG